MTVPVVFFGTPEAAVPALLTLRDSQDIDVVSVVTAPDRPKGRGMNIASSPVKVVAEQNGIPVYQPPTLRSDEAISRLQDLGADLFVVVAYGAILRKEVLDLPDLGCFNIHFSLLPKLRGAAPVQWAIANGDTLTGVTIMKMDEGLDTGPVLGRWEEKISDDDTSGGLESRLAKEGASLLADVLPSILDGASELEQQDDERATYAPKITPGDARIVWNTDAHQIANRVRAFDPRPGGWTTLSKKRIKIWRTSVGGVGSTKPPGTIEISMTEGVAVHTATTMLRLIEVQAEGGKRMAAESFARGEQRLDGARFE